VLEDQSNDKDGGTTTAQNDKDEDEVQDLAFDEALQDLNDATQAMRRATRVMRTAERAMQRASKAMVETSVRSAGDLGYPSLKRRCYASTQGEAKGSDTRTTEGSASTVRIRTWEM
jgi:hypothetical protein